MLKWKKRARTPGTLYRIKRQEFIATILIIRDVFDEAQPLNLALQKGNVSLCISDLPVHLETALAALEKLHLSISNNLQWFTKEQFEALLKVSEEETLIL